MTKSLYDPEVEKRGIEKGKEEVILSMSSKGLDDATISDLTSIDIERVKEITKKYVN